MSEFDFEETPQVPKRPSRRPAREVDTSPIASVAEPIVREHDRAVAQVEEAVPDAVEEAEEEVGSKQNPITFESDKEVVTPAIPSRPKREPVSSTATFMPTPVTEATFEEPSFNVKIPKKGMTTEEAAELEHKQEEEEKERQQERRIHHDSHSSSTPSIPSRPSRRPVPSSGSEQGKDVEGPSFTPTPVEKPVIPSRRPGTVGMTTEQAASLEHKEEQEYKAASTPFQPVEPGVERPKRPSSRPKRSVEPESSLTPEESEEALRIRIAQDKEMGISVGLGPMDKPVPHGVPKDDMALLHDSLTEGASDPTKVRTGPPVRPEVPKDDIALMMEGERGGVAGEESDFPTSVPGQPIHSSDAHTSDIPLDSVALKQKQEEEDDDDYSSRKVPLDAVAMEERKHAREKAEQEADHVGLDDISLQALKEKNKEKKADPVIPADPVPAEPVIPARPSRPAKRPSAKGDADTTAATTTTSSSSAASAIASAASVENLSSAREPTLDLSKPNPTPLADDEEEILEPVQDEPVVGVSAAEEEIEEVREDVIEEKTGPVSTSEKDTVSKTTSDSTSKDSTSESKDDSTSPISSVTSAAAAATAGIAAAVGGIAAAVVGDDETKDESTSKEKDESSSTTKDSTTKDSTSKDKDESSKEVQESSSSKPSPVIPSRPKPVSRTGSNLSSKSPLIPPRPMKRPGNNASSSSLGAGLSSDNLALTDEQKSEPVAKAGDKEIVKSEDSAKTAKPEDKDTEPAKPDESRDSSDSAPPKPAKRPPPVKPKPKIGAAFQAALEEKDKEFKPKPRVPVRSNKISALAKGLDGMFGAAGGPMVFGAPMPKKEVEEEEVSEASGGKSDLPPVSVDKEVKEEDEGKETSSGGASRRGRVKGPKRKLPSAAVSPWSCSVISDVWELVPKAKEAVHEAKEGLEKLGEDVEKKVEGHVHHGHGHVTHHGHGHVHDSSDDDFEDAREHVVHDDYIHSVGKGHVGKGHVNKDAHVHDRGHVTEGKDNSHVHVRKPLGEALDTAGHPTTHVDVLDKPHVPARRPKHESRDEEESRDQGEKSHDLDKSHDHHSHDHHFSGAPEPVETSTKSVHKGEPVRETHGEEAKEEVKRVREEKEKDKKHHDEISPVDTSSKSVHKEIPSPVDHVAHSSSIGNPENALYTSNDDVSRFSTSEKPKFTASEPDVIKSATHHHPYEVGSVSEPDVIKSATHHMDDQPFSEAVDVEAAVEGEVGESPSSIYSPAPTSAVDDRKQSVGSIIGGYLDTEEVKDVETIEEE